MEGPQALPAQTISVCFRRPYHTTPLRQPPNPSRILSTSLSLNITVNLSMQQKCKRRFFFLLLSFLFGFFFFFNKRCSTGQQGVPCLRLMSAQMRVDSDGINNLISLHVFLLSSPGFVFSRMWWLIRETAALMSAPTPASTHCSHCKH